MTTRPTFTPQSHDVILDVASIRSRGTYAVNVAVSGFKFVKLGGRVNASASTHTLLSVATIASLRGIRRSQLRAFTGKPTLLIRTSDPLFAEAINSRFQGEHKVGKQYVNELLPLLRKFNVEAKVVADNKMQDLLRHWSSRAVLAYVDNSGPAVLTPQVASVVV